MKENYSNKAVEIRLLKTTDYIALSDVIDYFKGQSIINITVYWDGLDGDLDIQVVERQSSRIPVWSDVKDATLTLTSTAGNKIFKITNTGSAEYSIKTTKVTASIGNISWATRAEESPFVSTPVENPLQVEVMGVADIEGTVTAEVTGSVSVIDNPNAPITVITDASEKSEDGLSSAQLIEQAMDRSKLSPIQVQLPKDLKQEPDGGLLLADMKGPYYWNSSTALQPFTLDCTGYQSIIIHKLTAGIITPYISNDLINFAGTNVTNVSGVLPSASTLPAATGIYMTPVLGRYFRLVGPASVVGCVIYLSQAPYVIQPYLNIAGTNAVTGGLAGTLGVGGPSAQNVAPTYNPVGVAGVDDNRTPLTRRLLTDDVGRLQIATSGDNTGINELGFSKDYKNRLAVQEVGDIEGSTELDLLKAILTELKVLNQQIFELPRLIDEGKPGVDEPESLRNERDMQ